MARIRQAVVLVALMMVAASCGSDGPTEPAATAPSITAQPQSAQVDAGATAMFSVTATGTAPLAYQWEKNGSAIAGATSASYTTPAVTAADDGAAYTVVVSNEAGSVESAAATLSVRTGPAITTQPASATVLGGVAATFSVTATGSDLEYQWRRDGTDIAGATNSSYTVGVPLAGDDGAVYTVVVTNPVGSVTSGAATLTVDTGNGLRPTSYANAKGRNRPVANLPHVQEARAFGDFFGAGNSDYFVATLNYSPQAPQSEAQPGEFRFYRWTGTGYELDAAKIDNGVGCLHPRKAVVADYNEDGRPDVFVACHGYDAAPFPGEANYVLLSSAGGVYERRAVAGGLAGFYHSATAFDVNNDGNTDVVVTNNFIATPIFAFMGDGAGNFTPRYDLFPSGHGNYFAVEAADVDGDGRTDLIAGGHDWENAPTIVLLNNGSGSFATAPRHELAAVANEGVVLDFTVLDADGDGANEIYVVRTSGGDGTFYQSRTVQRVLWPSLASSVLITERPAEWIDFMFPLFTGGQYSLISDNSTRPFSLPLN
ncbi:MAG TPA: FG-GAP-like repeat-containing protein [Longimicrobiales bacterium]|nr:FG-GAP-like repeat-containing protein [Longimicrobiales bacterium]